MVVHPSTVLSSQARHRSTTASLTNEQMLAIVWETMKGLTDRRRFERYLAVALMLQRYRYAMPKLAALSSDRLRPSASTSRPTLGLRPGLSCRRPAGVGSPAFPGASPPVDRGARTTSGERRDVQHAPGCRLSGEYELDLAAGPRLH